MISLSADAISNACARLSSTHGPAINASGSALPKRALPMVTTGFGRHGVLADDHEGRGKPGQRLQRHSRPPRSGESEMTAAGSLHRRKRRRPQERAPDIGDDRPVLLAVVARLVPRRIGLERVPFLLAVGERFPGQQVMVRSWLPSPISTVQKPACLMPCFSQIFSVCSSNRLSSAGSRPGMQV